MSYCMCNEDFNDCLCEYHNCPKHHLRKHRNKIDRPTQ